MQKFLQHYIYTNFEKSITTVELRETWENWVQDNYEWWQVNEILAKINWSQWMYNSALSPKPLDFTTVKGNESAAMASAFITLNGTGTPADYLDYNDYYTNLKVIFQDQLVLQQPEDNIPIMTDIDT